MITGKLVTVMRGEVRDIDEDAFREGVVRAEYYGEMWVPEELRYVQAVKSGGREVEALAGFMSNHAPAEASLRGGNRSFHCWVSGSSGSA